MSMTQAAWVKSLRHEAEGILGIELLPVAGQHFATFTAGAHVDVHLPNGLVRSYSLMNASSERDRYVLGVLDAPGGRGGSRWLHEQLKVGMPLTLSQPRNHFPLREGAAHSVLLAGGIGITPLYSMLLQLQAAGQSVELVYCARSRNQAALLQELSALGVALTVHFDDEHGAPPDLPGLLAGRPPEAHFYCCGPAPMLAAFEATTAALGYHNAYLERFAALLPAPHVAMATAKYELVLRKRGRTLQVKAGTSVLDALLDAGEDVEYSCCEGICGACQVQVLEGEVEHLDSVLSRAEQDAGKMMICVSRPRAEKLVLDL